MENAVNFTINFALLALTIGILVVFIRAIIGPRFTDRIMAINMIGTMVTTIICVLSLYLDNTSFVDVSIVYTLLSFLAVVIICHVVTLHHKGRELYLKSLEDEK